MGIFRCSYCGQAKPDDERSLEHPLSQVLGGSGWATRDVCGTCNEYAGREIDEPFARQTFILFDRHRYEVPDPRGAVPPAPRIVSRLKETGERVLTVMDRGGWYAQPLPVETWHDEQRVLYGVDADGAQEYVVKKLDRLRKQFGPQVTLADTYERTIENPQVDVEFTHDATLWPRFGAKVGLGFGREVLGEDWLDSGLAGYLREILFDRPTSVPSPYALLQPISEPLVGSAQAEFFVPPDHVVAVMGTDHGAALALFLFGDQRYLIPLGGEVTDDTRAVWIFDARTGKVERLSWNEYAERTAVRLVREHADRS
jgi:HNH endonuclease